MNKDDVKLLYRAFVTLCDYVEEDTGGGCLNCPLNHTICFQKTEGEAFAQALARIKAEI